LEPGVHVDPESPAAKQYALPLRQARQIGEGSSSATAASSSSAAPFGAGIKASGSSRDQSNASSRKPGGVSTGPEFAAGQQSAIPAEVLHASRSPAAGGSSLALLGGGIAVLVLGGLVGTIMRRRHRSTSFP
jgi:cobalamin biosynthesis Mg chelatase CobN